MLLNDCVLAAFLLTAPAEVPPPSEAPDPLRSSLVEVALEAELLDPREELAQSSAELSATVHLLQCRHAELRLAPPLSECERFPPRKVINELLSYNRAYRYELVARQAVDAAHAEELRTALAETDQLYRVWELLRDARCEFYYVAVRRQALQQLRDLVGLHAFYSGELPPHLPYWHFPRGR